MLLSIQDEDDLERILLAHSPKFRALLEAAEQRTQENGVIEHDVSGRWSKSKDDPVQSSKPRCNATSPDAIQQAQVQCNKSRCNATSPGAMQQVQVQCNKPRCNATSPDASHQDPVQRIAGTMRDLGELAR